MSSDEDFAEIYLRINGLECVLIYEQMKEH